MVADNHLVYQSISIEKYNLLVIYASLKTLYTLRASSLRLNLC